MANNNTDPSPAELGALVRRLRLEQGLSVDAFAKRAGLSPATVEALELGDSEFELDELLAIGRGLGMDLSAFFRTWEAQTNVDDLASNID
jgi:transcriptional regulator with XRE-family HTH domain